MNCTCLIWAKVLSIIEKTRFSLWFLFFFAFLCHKTQNDAYYKQRMTEETFQNEVQRLRSKFITLAQRYTNQAEDAEDIVQDVLLKLWQMRDDLVPPPDRLALVLTRNLCIDYQRRKKPRYTPQDIPEEEPVEDERMERMMRVIDTLPTRHQIILRLRHLEGMEIRDIAVLTNQTESAVRKMLSRARKETLELLKNKKKSNNEHDILKS